jgi:divalent metal cation (Fe/Co/Zn/Cd) transporter
MIQTREEEDHARTLMFIDFHLVVPGSTSVSAAHDICDRLERAVKEEFADARS